MVFVRDIAMGRVITNLMTVLNGLATTTLTNVIIQDGPLIGVPTVPDMILIGHNGDPDSDARPSYSQQPASLAGESRYETGEIPCAVISQTGDTRPAAPRARAVEILGVVATALYADRTLAGSTLTCQLTTGTEALIQNVAGAGVVLSFTISYLAHV